MSHTKKPGDIIESGGETYWFCQADLDGLGTDESTIKVQLADPKVPDGTKATVIAPLPWDRIRVFDQRLDFATYDQPRPDSDPNSLYGTRDTPSPYSDLGPDSEWYLVRCGDRVLYAVRAPGRK